LIGETEFLVPQRYNFPLNQLIQRDILDDGSGVPGRAIAIFVVFARCGTRRSHHTAFAMPFVPYQLAAAGV
jgi:hypothetical protein